MNNVDPILWLFYTLLAFLCPPIGVFLIWAYDIDGVTQPDHPVRAATGIGAFVWMIIFFTVFA